MAIAWKLKRFKRRGNATPKLPEINQQHHHDNNVTDRQFGSNISKTSARVSSGFQMGETLETTRLEANQFYCFQVFGNLMKPEA